MQWLAWDIEGNPPVKACHSATSSIASCSACLPFSSSSRSPSPPVASCSLFICPVLTICLLQSLTLLTIRILPLLYSAQSVSFPQPLRSDLSSLRRTHFRHCSTVRGPRHLLLKHCCLRRRRNMIGCKPGQKMKIQADRENARQPMGTALPPVHQTYRRFTHPVPYCASS